MMSYENQDMAGQASQPQPAIEKEEPISVPNILDPLDKDKQRTIASQCKEGFEEDLESRGEWETNIDDWIALAKQTKEDKTYP